MKKFIQWLGKFPGYCKACYQELRYKTTWPTGRELTHSAFVVVMASLVIAVVVFGMDSLFRWITGIIYPG